MTNTKILKALILIDILIGLISVMFFDMKIVWSTQFGFISSSLIMLASMESYRRMVNARVELNIITTDDTRDTIDKLEDPYDLYSEDIKEDEAKSLVEVVKDEKKTLKKSKRTFKQTAKDAKAALSIYRLGAYGVLIAGFLFLNKNTLLHTISYILALSVPMLVVVFMLIQAKDMQIEK